MLLLSLIKNLFILYCSSVVVMPIASVWQERKLWKSHLVPSLGLFGQLKVFLFNVVWMSVTLVGGLIVLVGKLFGFDAAYGSSRVEKLTGTLCSLMFVCPKIEIVGGEHLPEEDGSSPAPVYIANHASQIDLGVVYFLNRRFKWIAKDSVRYLPGVGLLLVLGEHVFIKRTGKNKKSISNLYEQSNQAIQSGLPMFLFPQGTRRMSQRLPFKDGAFRIALENKSKLVPISIHIPMNIWNSSYPFCLLWGGKVENVVVTVHEPIQAREGIDKEALKKLSYDAIFSVLPLIGEEITYAGNKKDR